ncbi:hypothetical protein BDW22DRAFT_1338518 [Trametopsis cervina]|nr:hypothetical protein BDW22DRAFT_1338518 [Trametopsis cervina]
MKTFLEEDAHTTYLCLLAIHASPDATAGCSRCQTCPSALYRCAECFRHPPYCKECIVAVHACNPLHRVEEWMESRAYWRTTTLKALGTVINLGHGVERCAKAFREPWSVCIVNERGLQDVWISFCECARDGKLVNSESKQLLEAGLWPGSWRQPRTAFSLEVLDDFQLLSTQGTITAQDYLTCLERKTDGVRPGDVKSRYREFLFAIRQHHFIKLCMRKGVTPSRGLEYGSLATLCPACPHIDVNISPQWQTRADDKLHLDALYHAIDGNFVQNLKDKGSDAADFPLTLGAGYFAHEVDSMEYFGAMPQEKYKSSSCNKFGAMGYSGHWGSVSGLVGLSCARHMFVLPGGTVDLKVGESFDAVDLCMLSGLRKWLGLRLHISAYDINCQYRIKFWERIAKIQGMITNKKLPALITIKNFKFPATRAAVGKFHEAAHKLACRLWNSFHYLPGAAQTDGEALERVWTHVTGLALRTREMSAGHRHDTINFFHDDMNWCKTNRLPTFLARKRAEAGRHFQASSVTQTQLTADLEEIELPEGTVEGWRTAKGKWEEVVTTVRSACLLLSLSRLSEETVSTMRSDLSSRLEAWTKAASIGLTPAITQALSGVRDKGSEKIDLAVMEQESWILQGRALSKGEVCQDRLDIQYIDRIQKQEEEEEAEEEEEEEVEEEEDGKGNDKTGRATTTTKTTKKRKRPTVRKGSKAARNFSLELREYVIHLPSSYPPDVRECAALQELVLIEHALRKVQADTALDNVRSHLAASYGLHRRLARATTQQLKQRAKGPTERVHASVTAAANVYRRARAAMQHLGMADDDPTYRPLKKQDLKALVIHESDRKYGDSRKPQHSWIWGCFSFIVGKEGLSESVRNTMIETLRVHWCRGQATLDRWKEEVELIEEEMRRAIWFFDYEVALWEARVTARLNGGVGSAEYARK